MKNHPFFDEKIISMNVYSFWKKCFDQNEASQYDSNVKRMFYYRILELKNPTKLNLAIIFWNFQKMLIWKPDYSYWEKGSILNENNRVFFSKNNYFY